MLRNRYLSGEAGALQLITIWDVDPSSDDLLEDRCGLEIVYNPDSPIPLSVRRVFIGFQDADSKDDSKFFPFPSIGFVSDEVIYFLNLIKSLSYGSSSSSFSPHFEEI